MFFSGFEKEAEPVQTFGYKGFHRKNYTNSTVKESAHYRPDNYRRKALFHAQGVEQNSYSGLQYGSGRDYTISRKTVTSDTHHDTELPVRRMEADQLDYQYPWSRERETIHKRSRPIPVTDTSYNPFGRSGGGAPVKTTSGRCIAARTIAPDIRFQKQLKKVVDQGLRYKNNDGAGVSTPSNAMTRTPSEIEKRETDRRKKEIYAMKLEEQRVESQETKHRMERENKVKGHQYNPWGRDIPLRDEDGMIQRRRREIDQKGVVNGKREGQDQCWLKGLGGCVVNRPHRIADTSGDQGYNPWGRPGCGAPITTENGQIMTSVRGKFSRNEEESGSQPNEHGTSVADWLRGPKIPSQTKATPTMTTMIRDPSDTVLLQEAQLRHRRGREEREGNKVYGPLITNSSPEKEQIASKQQQYSIELQQMIQNKQCQQRRDRERQCEGDSKHMTTFNQMWGRPGGGAPRVKEDEQLDVSPRSYGTLNTFMTHTGQHKYRRS